MHMRFFFCVKDAQLCRLYTYSVKVALRHLNFWIFHSQNLNALLTDLLIGIINSQAHLSAEHIQIFSWVYIRRRKILVVGLHKQVAWGL